MTQRTPSFLKQLFENGDIPQATDYEDVFDSYVNLETSAAQTMSGNLIVPNIRVSGTVSADSIRALSGAYAAIVTADSIHVNERLFNSYGAINAAGTTQSTSTVVSADVNFITVSDTARGVVLLDHHAGSQQYLVNNTASTTAASVFPSSGCNFIGTAANAHILLAAGQTVQILHVGASAYAFQRY